MSRWARALIGLLVVAAAAGCGSSVRTDEGLAMLEVSVGDGVAPVASVRFSVVGRPSITSHEVHYDPLHPLLFGYYLPGPPGPAQVQAEGLAPAGCVVGRGSASVDVQLGRVSPAVALVIGPAAGTRSDGGVLCRSSADASVDHRPTDARSADAHGSDARADSHPTDARADSHPTDARVDSHPTDAGAPMCLAATRACSATSACCSGLTCNTNSIGKVCCGAFGARCTLANGTDCCGQLECINGGCCLPATRPCQGSDCCLGLTCGTTSLGKVCCGNSGAPCTHSDGTDCCGTLSCRNGTCAP